MMGTLQQVVGIMYQPQLLMMGLIAIAVFATVVTLAMPLLQGDKLQARMKSVASERIAMRKKERARLFEDAKRPSLRRSPKSFMKIIVEQLNLHKLLEANDTREKLRMAGLRGQAPLITFLFFRLVMPVIVFAGQRPARHRQRRRCDVVVQGRGAARDRHRTRHPGRVRGQR